MSILAWIKRKFSEVEPYEPTSLLTVHSIAYAIKKEGYIPQIEEERDGEKSDWVEIFFMVEGTRYTLYFNRVSNLIVLSESWSISRERACKINFDVWEKCADRIMKDILGEVRLSNFSDEAHEDNDIALGISFRFQQFCFYYAEFCKVFHRMLQVVQYIHGSFMELYEEECAKVEAMSQDVDLHNYRTMGDA